jgi:hypothetical protein
LADYAPVTSFQPDDKNMRTFFAVLFGFSCLIAAQKQGVAASICIGQPANLVANCGFETGDFTSWMLSGNDVPTELNFQYGVEGTDPLDGIAPNSGSYQAFFADLASNATILSQTITTIPGDPYSISWFMVQDTTPVSPYTNLFTMAFGGADLVTLSGIPAQGYTEYTAWTAATSTSTTLDFTFGNDLGEFLLDDVIVTQSPEPGSWFLVLTGGALFGLMRLRRARKV